MASICNDPGGRKRIQFIDGDGIRRTIHLGTISSKLARSVKTKIEAILSDKSAGQAHDIEVAKWIGGLEPKMRQKLSAVGLVRDTDHQNATIGALLEQFFASLTVKPSTIKVYSQARRNLIDHFGQAKCLRSIGSLQAEKWRQYLVSLGLGQPTVSKRVKTARQAFKCAVKWKMIAENPFEGVRAGSQTNRSRMFFLSLTDVVKLLAACPDDQWRLIVALSRFGGLRCPSEHLALRLSDIHWDQNRIWVPSCKTEHLEGHEGRWVPIFPELMPHLLAVYHAAEPGTEYVITRYRSKSQNLRTQLGRIIKRAGLTPWPKPFHNLRSTRQTELAERFPIHVVCAWLGNSRAVAQDHYLQITDAHFALAASEATKRVAQNATQHGAELARTSSQVTVDQKQNRPEFPSDSAACDSLQVGTLTPTGFEHCPEHAGKSLIPKTSGAESDAFSNIACLCPRDRRDLSTLVNNFNLALKVKRPHPQKKAALLTRSVSSGGEHKRPRGGNPPLNAFAADAGHRGRRDD